MIRVTIHHVSNDAIHREAFSSPVRHSVSQCLSDVRTAFASNANWKTPRMQISGNEWIADVPLERNEEFA